MLAAGRVVKPEGSSITLDEALSSSLILLASSAGIGTLAEQGGDVTALHPDHLGTWRSHT